MNIPEEKCIHTGTGREYVYGPWVRDFDPDKKKMVKKRRVRVLCSKCKNEVDRHWETEDIS